jgi:hypothetical protein
MVRFRLRILIAIILFMEPALAGGEKFSCQGTYSLGRDLAYGESVQLTLALRLTNAGEAQLDNVVIVLEDSALPHLTYLTHRESSWRSGDTVKIREDVTVPAREFQRWRDGAALSIRVEAQGEAGQRVVLHPAVQRTVEREQ